MVPPLIFLWIKPSSEQSEQEWESQEPLTSTVDLISMLNFNNFFSLSGQENPLNLSHLCQKLWCLSSQSQWALAPPACTGGPLVLPVVWDESPIVPRGGCPGPCSAQHLRHRESPVHRGSLSGMWQQPQEQAGGENWGCV